MIRATLIPQVLSVLLLFCVSGGFCREAGTRETNAVAAAQRSERHGDWVEAGKYWELATLAAEDRGAVDTAIEHAGHALKAWRNDGSARARNGEVFALGVMSKLDVMQGRLARGRERNLQALAVLRAQIIESSSWRPVAGQPMPETVPQNLREAWARAQRDTAMWLDAQGRTIEAVDLLTSTEKSIRATQAGRHVQDFYHRKLISTRAGMLKFLGFHEQAIEDLQMLERTSATASGPPEWARRMNLPYFSSQFYGPRPEYLDQVRAVWREFQETGRVDRDMRRMLAKMAYAYGETGANIADLESIVAEAKAAGAELEAFYAQRDLAVLNAGIGHRAGVEAALIESLKALRARGVKRGEPTLYREYGEFLVQEGRPAEGLRMLHEAVRMTRGFGWTQHLPQLLMLVADAQGILGDVRGIEQTLKELEAVANKGDLTPHRLFLAHCACARALFMLGRSAEAKDAVSRANAVADAAKLNDYQRFALKWTKDVKPLEGAGVTGVEEQKADGIIDLQPVDVLARDEAGKTAVAGFQLSNATGRTVRGTLALSGPGLAVRYEGGVAQVELELGGTMKSAELDVEVLAGDAVPIRAEAKLAAASGGLKMEWKGTGRAVRAIGHFVATKSDAVGEVPTMTNTSLAFSNPFYAIPFHHAVPVDAGVQNLRVKASAPCRIELVEVKTGGLLAVDANGDGQFNEAGDNVAVDADSDGFPDVSGDSEKRRAEIEVLVFPLSGAPQFARDLRVELQSKTNDGWRAVGRDILKSPRR